MRPETLGVGLVSVGWMGRLHSRANSPCGSTFPKFRYPLC